VLYETDVLLGNGLIVAVGRNLRVENYFPPTRKARVIDATGRYVTPGIVDIHRYFFALLQATLSRFPNVPIRVSPVSLTFFLLLVGECSHMGLDSWPSLRGGDDTNEGTNPSTYRK
jgi:hypothetical protein